MEPPIGPGRLRALGKRGILVEGHVEPIKCEGCCKTNTVVRMTECSHTAWKSVSNNGAMVRFRIAE